MDDRKFDDLVAMSAYLNKPRRTLKEYESEKNIDLLWISQYNKDSEKLSK